MKYKIYKSIAKILFKISISLDDLVWYFHDQGIYIERKIEEAEYDKNINP